MDDRPKIFPPDPNETRRWMGRLLVAVIVGEGIWNFIVALMNYVVVPWLGDVLGQSSGLPTSFTQRPYDYPDLFVAVIELCLAGLVAVGINAFFQGPQQVKIRLPNRSVAPVAVPVTPTQVVPPTPPAPVEPRPVVAQQPAPPPTVVQPSQPLVSTPVIVPPSAPKPAPAPVVETRPVPAVQPTPTPRIEVKPVAQPIVPPAPVAAAKIVPAPVATAKAVPIPPESAPVKAAAPAPPKKAKKVYYNSVGDPIEFDDED